jgi:hypothetical protein
MTSTANSLTIEHYHDTYAGIYKQLNIAWIEKFFIVEEHDLEQLKIHVNISLTKAARFSLQNTTTDRWHLRPDKNRRL